MLSYKDRTEKMSGKAREKMKATGIVRKIDELGRIVLPVETRKILDINTKDPVEIYMDNDSIVLRKYQPACMFCGSADETVRYKGKLICKECVEAMNTLFAEGKIKER